MVARKEFRFSTFIVKGFETYTTRKKVLESLIINSIIDAAMAISEIRHIVDRNPPLWIFAMKCGLCFYYDKERIRS